MNDTNANTLNLFTELDILGTTRRVPAQWMTPMEVTKKPGCVVCSAADLGPRGGINRYVLGS